MLILSKRRLLVEDSETFVRIEGEPFLSRAKAHRDKVISWRRAWSEFAKSKGATGHTNTGTCLAFDGTRPPDGWTKPQRTFSRPKKGHPDCAELDRMRNEHPRPKGSDVFGDALCESLSYEYDGGKGSYGIGGFGMIVDGPWVGWAGDVFLGHIPDAEAAVRWYAKTYPDRRAVGPAATWKMPDGLTRISQAEYELILAQAKVEAEQSAVAKSKAAA